MKDGVLVHIDSVESGLACGCVCSVCSSPLLARKGKKNIHHFSHNGDSNCNPETVLHWLGKQLLFNRIKQCIDNQTGLSFERQCNCCNSTHPGKLTKDAASVRLEYSLGSIRPDITIFDSSGRPRIALEVVVSHPPEPETIEYCNKKKIYLFTANLKNENDLSELEHGLPRFNGYFDYCLTHKKCPKCGIFSSKKFVYVNDIECRECHKLTKFAIFCTDIGRFGTHHFSEKDFIVAKERGTILFPVYDEKTGAEFTESFCSHCGEYSGNVPIHHFINDLPTEDDNKVFTGYYCTNCKNHFE